MAGAGNNPSRSDPTEYFTGLAVAYDAHRPGYPTAAIDAALSGLPALARVVDIGCGTGICSRAFARAKARVTGIDPNRDMLDRARRSGSGEALTIRYRRGTAERTGLEADAADLVVCAQAFHWFDADAALAEFHRVLDRGGRLALMWNVRDTTVPFGAEYEHLVDRAQADATTRGLHVPPERAHALEVSELFTGVRTRPFPNPQPLDWPGLLGRARSASYFPRSGPLRTELEASLRASFDRHARNGRVVMPQWTWLTMADRRGKGAQGHRGKRGEGTG